VYDVLPGDPEQAPLKRVETPSAPDSSDRVLEK
jgi:hypothetical protein